MVFIKEKREEGGEDGRNRMNLKIMAEMPDRPGCWHVPRISRHSNFMKVDSPLYM